MTEQAPPPSKNATSEWATARGEKWRAHLAGLEATLEPVNDPLIRALHLDTPGRIADVGCGGGGTTLEILRRAPAGSVVRGFDISPALVESARARAPSDEHDIAFAVEDVATASQPQRPYDRLVSRFGIMFYDDPPAAFTNLARWLAPGGRLAFAVWGPPADNPWMSSVRELAAAAVDVPPPDPAAPGPFRYASADPLLALLDRAGLTDLEVNGWQGALQMGGGLPAAEAVHFALSSFSIGDMLADAGVQALDEVRQSLTDRFSRHLRDGTVQMSASVHIVTGRAPG